MSFCEIGEETDDAFEVERLVKDSIGELTVSEGTVGGKRERANRLEGGTSSAWGNACVR